MSQALFAGVWGLRAHQRMLDVAGNNLANLNTSGFKASRVLFSDLLSSTLTAGTQPTTELGGTNPQQVGSGVNVASIDRIVTQGSPQATGRPLDMAIEGEGYFVCSDGTQEVYTRVGAFAADADNYLVDPATGYRVRRIGTTGEADGFQNPASADIYIPFDVALPAQATAEISYTGNLSADETSSTTNQMRAGMAYSTTTGNASDATLLANLLQASGLAVGDTITITGSETDGAAITPVVFNIDPATSTLGDLVTAIDGAFTGASARLANGEIYLDDDAAGFSRTDINLSYAGAGTFTLPGYFDIVVAGGAETRSSTIEVFDSAGVSHMLMATFCRQGSTRQWDLVANSLTDGYALANRRIQDITFSPDGSFNGVLTGSAQFDVEFSFNPGNLQTIQVDLGTAGAFNGVTQFGGISTAAATNQDGYEPGSLSSLSVSEDGTILGMFTNGLRRNIATLRLAVFRNPAGLLSIGGNYFLTSANSGIAVGTRALSAGAGSIHGGALESSNVDMAEEFVTLIRAQRGFQANARTITITDRMLSELSNIVR